jgi:multisubunit Na+/H+ antiporter MnhG subunit
MNTQATEPNGQSNLSSKPLSILLLLNAVFTFLGGVGLISIPDKITYGMPLNHQANFLFYLLGCSAFSLAVLSFSARTFVSRKGLRIAELTY